MLLTVKDTIALLKISRATLTRWTKLGIVPRPLKIGGSVRFRKSDIDQFIANGGVQHGTRNPMVASCWAPDQDDVPAADLGSAVDLQLDEIAEEQRWQNRVAAEVAGH